MFPDQVGPKINTFEKSSYSLSKTNDFGSLSGRLGLPWGAPGVPRARPAEPEKAQMAHSNAHERLPGELWGLPVDL